MTEGKWADGREVLWEVAVICTDQGQHKRIRLSTATHYRLADWSTGIHMTHALRHFSGPDESAEPGTPISRHSYTFICPLCRRNPVIDREKWNDAITGAHSLKLREIDLSMVGF